MSESLPPQRAWVYSRVSGRTQEDNGSLDDQALSCHRYAQAHGYAVVGQTREVFTGGEMERPAFDEVVARARAGEIDVIVADKVDRFTRAEAAETYATIYELLQAGARVEVTEIDPANPFADLIFSILTNLASHERKSIATRTAGGRRRDAEAGKLRYARVGLYGYRLVRAEDAPDGKARYVVDEEAAAVVRRCIGDIASGVTLRTLVKRLNAEGVETPSSYQQRVYGVTPSKTKRASAGWQVTFLARFYTNPTYWGERFTGMTERRKVKHRDAAGRLTWSSAQRKRQLGEAGSYPLPDAPPALVSKEDALAARVQARQNYDTKTKDVSSLAPFAQVRGMAFCGHCGGALRMSRQRNRRTGALRGASYQCDKNMHNRHRGYVLTCPETAVGISNGILDPGVWDQVVAIMTDTTTLRWAVEKSLAGQDAAVKQAQEKRDRLLKQAAEADRRADNYEAAVGVTDNREVLQRLVYQAGEARDQAASWRAEAARQATVGADADAIRAAAKDLEALQVKGSYMATNLAAMDYMERHEFFQELGVTVKVYSARSANAGETPRWEMSLTFAGLREAMTVASSAATHATAASISMTCLAPRHAGHTLTFTDTSLRTGT